MAVAQDGRLALLVAGKLHGTVALAEKRNWSVLKFCNGDLMGEKLKYTKLKQRHQRSGVAGPRVCMSLTADLLGETKVSVLLIVLDVCNKLRGFIAILHLTQFNIFKYFSAHCE